MSDIAKLHAVLAGFVFLLMAAVFVYSPVPESSAYSALASPYCANRQFDVSIEGSAAYVKNLRVGDVLYEKNAETQLALASLTKLMTVLTASDVLSETDVVTISNEALTPEGGSLELGDVWHAGDLMDYTLITSDNDAAHALGRATSEKTGQTPESFIERMNAKASVIGLAQTYFTNDTGLDFSESVGGNYGSAKDVATLLSYALVHNPRAFEASTMKEKKFVTLAGREYLARNTTDIVTELPGIRASKTGFTDIAGRNLAVVFEPMLGYPVVAVVLGSTEEGRDTDMKKIAAETKRWITRAILCGSNGY